MSPRVWKFLRITRENQGKIRKKQKQIQEIQGLNFLYSIFYMFSYSTPGPYLRDRRRKTNSPQVFGHNSAPLSRRDTRISGNASYKPPGAPYILQDPAKLQKKQMFQNTSVVWFPNSSFESAWYRWRQQIYKWLLEELWDWDLIDFGQHLYIRRLPGPSARFLWGVYPNSPRYS